MKYFQTTKIGIITALTCLSLCATAAAVDPAANNFKHDLESLELGRDYVEKMQAFTDGQQQTIIKLRDAADSELRAKEIDAVLLGIFMTLRDNAAKITPPFLMEEREQRFDLTRSVIDNPSIGQDQKLRSLMELYLTEIDYGKSISSYKSSITTKDGDIAVDILRVGLSTFIAKLPGGSSYLVWNQQQGSWDSTSADKEKIESAFKMSRNAAAMDILTIPSIVVASEETAK